MSAEFQWIEEWPAPGICRLAQSRVEAEGTGGGQSPSRPCTIWLLVHANEAALIEAPFASEDAAPILERIRSRLEERRLWVKFFSATHLHRGHATGLASVAQAFPRATFVYPESWLAHRRALGLGGGRVGALDPLFDRGLAFSYGSVMEFDLAGEPVAFIRAPYHSPTDQLVVFRGVAIAPDWQLPRAQGERVEKAQAPEQEKRAAMRRVLDFCRGYQIHSHLPAHGDGPLEAGFAERVQTALASLQGPD